MTGGRSVPYRELEQRDSITLGEMARVSGRHTLRLEPFWDSNDRGLRRDYLWTRDHFRGRIDELSGYGREPIPVTDDRPGEIWRQPCLVVCRKCAAVR